MLIVAIDGPSFLGFVVFPLIIVIASCLFGNFWQSQTGTCRGCLPSASTKIKSCAAVVADPQHPLKEFSVENRNKALCALGNWQEKSLDS